MFCLCCRNFWVRLTLGMILNVAKNLKRTRHHHNCEFCVFHYHGSFLSDSEFTSLHCDDHVRLYLMELLIISRPMVSEPINSSLFHQLAEQLQQQNLEQFQKQLLEHQQHHQKVDLTDIYTPCTLHCVGVSLCSPFWGCWAGQYGENARTD